MRGKLLDGSWRTLLITNIAQHRINDYCEGNAWQYLWLTLKTQGTDLIYLEEMVTTKLDELFSMSSDLEERSSMDITND